MRIFVLLEGRSLACRFHFCRLLPETFHQVAFLANNFESTLGLKTFKSYKVKR
jgi:hypothetical protein